MQILPPSSTPEGPAAHKRAKPPRTEECTRPADATAANSWSDSGCVWGTLCGCFSPPYILPILARAYVSVDRFRTADFEPSTTTHPTATPTAAEAAK